MRNFLFLIFMLCANTLFAQYINLDKLPENQRNKILVQITNDAINKYSTGYLRKGAKPIIDDIGILTVAKKDENRELPSIDKYIGRHIYSISYKSTDEEHNYYKKDYLVRAYILADVGKVTAIRYIDDYGYIMARLEESDNNEIIDKRRFVTVSERLIEDEKRKPKPVITVPDSSMMEVIKRRKQREDSIRNEVLKRNLELKKKLEVQENKNSNINIQK